MMGSNNSDMHDTAPLSSHDGFTPNVSHILSHNNCIEKTRGQTGWPRLCNGPCVTIPMSVVESTLQIFTV